MGPGISPDSHSEVIQDSFWFSLACYRMSDSHVAFWWILSSWGTDDRQYEAVKLSKSNVSEPTKCIGTLLRPQVVWNMDTLSQIARKISLQKKTEIRLILYPFKKIIAMWLMTRVTVTCIFEINRTQKVCSNRRRGDLGLGAVEQEGVVATLPHGERFCRISVASVGNHP